MCPSFDSVCPQAMTLYTGVVIKIVLFPSLLQRCSQIPYLVMAAERSEWPFQRSTTVATFWIQADKWRQPDGGEINKTKNQETFFFKASLYCASSASSVYILYSLRALGHGFVAARLCLFTPFLAATKSGWMRKYNLHFTEQSFMVIPWLFSSYQTYTETGGQSEL